MQTFKSFTEIFDDLINNEYSLNVYFGSIIHKLTSCKLHLDVLNPIIMTKLPSLYKFSIKNNKLPKKSIIYEKYLPDIVKPVSISYIYFPRKEYHAMIYQYIGEKEKNGSMLTIGKNQEIVFEIDKKNTKDVLQQILCFNDDLQAKKNIRKK